MAASKQCSLLQQKRRTHDAVCGCQRPAHAVHPRCAAPPPCRLQHTEDELRARDAQVRSLQDQVVRLNEDYGGVREQYEALMAKSSATDARKELAVSRGRRR